MKHKSFAVMKDLHAQKGSKFVLLMFKTKTYSAHPLFQRGKKGKESRKLQREPQFQPSMILHECCVQDNDS